MAKAIVNPKLHVRKGDTVRVITGKEKGKDGRILRIVKKVERKTGAVQFRAIIEGLNMATKHKKRGENNQEGSIIEREASIHISNLMLLDPKSSSPTRIGRKKTQNGWVRVSKKSGEIIK